MKGARRALGRNGHLQHCELCFGPPHAAHGRCCAVGQRPYAFELTSSRGGSTAVARIEPGAVVDIMQCDGEDCEVDAGSQKGWVPQKNLWGVYPRETVK